MHPCSLGIVDDPDSLFEGSNATRPPPTAATSFCLGEAVFKIKKGSFIKNFVFGNHSFCLGEEVFKIRKGSFMKNFVFGNHSFCLGEAVFKIRKGSFIKNFVFGNHSFCLGEAVFEIRKRAFIQGFVLDNHLAFLIWPAVALVRTLYFPRRRNLYLFVK